MSKTTSCLTSGLESRSHIFSVEKTDEAGSRKFVSGDEQIIRDQVLHRPQSSLFFTAHKEVVMTPEKICSVVAMYRARFEKEGIPKQRMDPQKFFNAKEEMLAHAYHLTDTTEEYARDPETYGKANRHLASLQTLLWTAGWYTLADLMNHNRP